MNKSELVRTVAREKRIKPSDAADRIDHEVNRIIRKLRKGTPAHIPGVGTLTPGKPVALEPERD